MGKLKEPMRELVVYTVNEEDIAIYMGTSGLNALKEENLVDAALHEARELMWISNDATDWFGDCVAEAVRNVLGW